MASSQSNSLTDDDLLTWKSKIPFLQERADQSLRICCYGSSSSATPVKYMKQAERVGLALASRGHVSVNGAGSFGCMAALNYGAVAGNGAIVGVIHEMWLVDDQWKSATSKERSGKLRDGGEHSVFDMATLVKASEVRASQVMTVKEGERILLVAGGKDLQERKRLLVQGADALIVLPGGVGTWDELWEMACQRNLGLSQLPIVCVNVDGYYDAFQRMLERAAIDKLIKREPEQIVHFAPTAEAAVKWVEETVASCPTPVEPVAKRSTPLTSMTSVLGRALSWMPSWVSSSEDSVEGVPATSPVFVWALTAFAAGVAAGVVMTNRGLSSR